MFRIKEIPSSGAFLRSSVHFAQVSWISSPGAGNVLAITPSKTPSWSTTRTHTTGLPSSIFCHSPAADGSAACPGTMKASSITRTVVTGSASPNLVLASLVLASLIRSIDPELFLQAGRRRRILEHQPFVRIDITMRLLCHQRTFVEAAQDQLQLAGIGVDVADPKNSGHVGLES